MQIPFWTVTCLLGLALVLWAAELFLFFLVASVIVILLEVSFEVAL